MLIAQISDLHISELGSKTFGIAPMAENLAACINHINQLASCPDLVLVTGDISNSGKIEELIHAKNLLDSFNMPYYVIPGNHDNRQDLLSVFGEKSCQLNPEQLINYTINGYEVRLIAIDSSIPNKAGGEFTPASAQWLDQQLKQSNDQPVIIFMHHPPVNVGIAETDIEGFKGKELLTSIIKKYSNIEAILCGHIHLSAHTRWHGTIVSTAPSIGMRLVIDFSMEHASQYTLDAPNYQLHNWTDDKNLVTFDVNVNNANKGYPFH